MSSDGGAARAGPAALTAELVRQYDGAERVPALPSARLVSVAPATRNADPVLVAIEWVPGVVERPAPGSSLWRAALAARLAEPSRDTPDDALVREQIEQSLARFPDLESWWHWVRTGWLAAPHVDSVRPAWPEGSPWWRW